MPSFRIMEMLWKKIRHICIEKLRTLGFICDFCLWSTAEGSSHYLNCSCCGHFVNLLPKCTSRFPFWGKHLRCTSGLNLAAHLGQVLALLELSVRNNTHHVSHLKVFSIVFLGVYKLLKFSKFPPPVVLSARP